MDILCIPQRGEVCHDQENPNIYDHYDQNIGGGPYIYYMHHSPQGTRPRIYKNSNLYVQNLPVHAFVKVDSQTEDMTKELEEDRTIQRQKKNKEYRNKMPDNQPPNTSSKRLLRYDA